MGIKLSKSQLEALRKIEKLSAQKAITSLSKLLRRKVDIRFSAAKVMPFARVPRLVGQPQDVSAVICFGVEGAISGSMILIFPLREALKVTALLLEKKSLKELDGFALSGLEELGNIVVGSYVTSLSKITQTRVIHSVPALVIDMLEAVLDEALASQAQRAEFALVLQSEFFIGKEKARGCLVFLPSPQGFQRLTQCLG